MRITLVTGKGDHTIRWTPVVEREDDEDITTYNDPVITCHAAPESYCKWQCTGDCESWYQCDGECEGYDHPPLLDLHDVNGHPLKAVPCNAVEYITAWTDGIEECGPSFPDHHDGPVTVWWDGDSYEWEYADGLAPDPAQLTLAPDGDAS